MINSGIDGRYNFIFSIPCIGSSDYIDMTVDYKDIDINNDWIWNRSKDAMIDHKNKAVNVIFKKGR